MIIKLGLAFGIGYTLGLLLAPLSAVNSPVYMKYLLTTINLWSL